MVTIDNMTITDSNISDRARWFYQFVLHWCHKQYDFQTGIDMSQPEIEINLIGSTESTFKEGEATSKGFEVKVQPELPKRSDGLGRLVMEDNAALLAHEYCHVWLKRYFGPNDMQGHRKEINLTHYAFYVDRNYLIEKQISALSPTIILHVGFGFKLVFADVKRLLADADTLNFPPPDGIRFV